MPHDGKRIILPSKRSEAPDDSPISAYLYIAYDHPYGLLMDVLALDQEDSELNAWFAQQEQPIKDLENVFQQLAAEQSVAVVPKQSAKPQKPIAAKPESIPESKPTAKVTTEKVKATGKPGKKKPES